LNEGKIEQIGLPLDLYQRPANLFVAGFIGAPRMNFLKVRAEHTTEEAVVVAGPDFPSRLLSLAKTKPGEVAQGAELTLGLRPEHIHVCEGGSGLSTLLIEVTENLGDLTFLHGTTPAGTRITLNVKGFQNYRYADAVGFSFEAKHGHLFDSTGSAV
jgi:ABC-type sugar transport system ATPase subunit